MIVVDVMLGRFIKMERPMEDAEEIINVGFIKPDPQKRGSKEEEKIVVYNNKYYRY